MMDSEYDVMGDKDVPFELRRLIIHLTAEYNVLYRLFMETPSMLELPGYFDRDVAQEVHELHQKYGVKE